MCYKNENVPHECDYRGYEINIEKDPDPYRENLIWEIAYDDIIWDSGTGYSLEQCLKDSKEAIDLRFDSVVE